MRPSISSGPGLGGITTVRTDLANESLYGRLAAHFCVHLSGLPETTLPEHVLSRPLFRPWLPQWSRRMAAFLGCTPAEFARLRGTDLVGAGDVQLVLSQSLRFCRSCLRDGYHSVIFQHMAVFRCERHNEALHEGCPYCRLRITPSVRTVRDFPWHCPNCEVSLAKVRLQGEGRDDAAGHDLALQAWRPVLRRGAVEVTNVRHLSLNALVGGGASAVVSRHVQRAIAFEEPGSSQGWRFRTEVVPVGKEEVAFAREHPELGRSAANAGLAPLLQWLSRHCPSASGACHLAERLGRDPGGQRVNRRVGVLGALLCKTLYCYGLMEDFRGIHSLGRTDLRFLSRICAPIRYTQPIVECPRLDARLLQLEVLSLFAKLLAGFRDGTPLVQLDWLRPPEPVFYVPSWVARPDGCGGMLVHVRTRATEATLKRLFARFRFRAFALDPNLPAGSRAEALFADLVDAAAGHHVPQNRDS